MKRAKKEQWRTRVRGSKYQKGKHFMISGQKAPMAPHEWSRKGSKFDMERVRKAAAFGRGLIHKGMTAAERSAALAGRIVRAPGRIKEAYEKEATPHEAEMRELKKQLEVEKTRSQIERARMAGPGMAPTPEENIRRIDEAIDSWRAEEHIAHQNRDTPGEIEAKQKQSEFRRLRARAIYHRDPATQRSIAERIEAMGGKTRKWIQPAIKKPGALRRYVRERFGEKGFDVKGRIKKSILHQLAKDGLVGQRARLALRLREFQGGKRKRALVGQSPWRTQKEEEEWYQKWQSKGVEERAASALPKSVQQYLKSKHSASGETG